MTELADASPVVADPIVRSNLYRLLAQGFKYPTQEMFDLYRSGQFMLELLELFASAPHLSEIALEEASVVEKVRQGLEGMNWRDFEVKYVSTFDVGVPEPPCPPYGGLYTDGMPRTAVMMDVAEFYKHFGLAMSQAEYARELPDYVCAELEFLHFLTFKEAQAIEQDNQELLNGYVLAQKDFLERHMINWFQKFCERVQDVEALEFYPDLARIVLRFINSEFAFVSAMTQEGERAQVEA